MKTIRVYEPCVACSGRGNVPLPGQSSTQLVQPCALCNGTGTGALKEIRVEEDAYAARYEPQVTYRRVL